MNERPLSEREVADLQAALDDEYRSRAVYAQVIADFGEVMPFTNIVEAEKRHIEALSGIFERYGLEVPADRWSEDVPRYESVLAACRDGIDAEIDNAALYDRVIAGTSRPDILAVYRNLQRASQENHLPAFRRGVERESGGGDRPGEGGRRRRHRGGR